MAKDFKYAVDDDNIALVLLYSRVTIALNAARIMKVLGNMNGMLGRAQNRTEEYLIRFAANTLLLNAAAVFDSQKAALNLRRLVSDLYLNSPNKDKMLKEVDKIQNRHQKTIQHVEQWRNNLIAHTNKKLNSVEKFMDIKDGDVAHVQLFLSEVADFLESLDQFPSESLKLERVIDYADIRNHLKG